MNIYNYLFIKNIIKMLRFLARYYGTKVLFSETTMFSYEELRLTSKDWMKSFLCDSKFYTYRRNGHGPC